MNYFFLVEYNTQKVSRLNSSKYLNLLSPVKNAKFFKQSYFYYLLIKYQVIVNVTVNLFRNFIKCLPKFLIKPQWLCIFHLKCLAFKLLTVTKLSYFRLLLTEIPIKRLSYLPKTQWQFFTKQSSRPFQASLIYWSCHSQELKGKAEETWIGKYFDIIDPDDKLSLSTCQARGVVQKHRLGDTGS